MNLIGPAEGNVLGQPALVLGRAVAPQMYLNAYCELGEGGKQKL